MAKSQDQKAKSIVDHIRGKFSADSALVMGEGSAKSQVTKVIPTGISVLDNYVFGCGGLPIGRIIELYSEPGAGKSSFALHACAQVQKQGGLAILVETEDSVAMERAETFGLDLDSLILLQPAHLEEALGQIEEALKAAKKYRASPILLVWDSIAATASKAEVEDGLIGKTAMAEKARIFSRAMKLLAGLARKADAAVLLINQIRATFQMYGPSSTTSGGSAIKFHASLRVQLYSGASFKDGPEHTGKAITFSCEKNRFSSPWRKAKVRLDFFEGWNEEWSLIEHAKELKIIPKSARGKAKYEEALASLNEFGWSRRERAKAGVKVEKSDEEELDDLLGGSEDEDAAEDE